MGVREVPTCDIFGTLQSKGLRTLLVQVFEHTAEEPKGRSMFSSTLEVGNRGADRVLRMVTAATEPPKKREAIADVLKA